MRKISFYWYLKSWYCLLKYCHPMKCLVSQQKRVFNTTNSNATFSESKKYLPNFVLHFRNLHKIRNTLKKKRWASKVTCFLNYRLQKAGLLKCLKSPVSGHLRKANMLQVRKHCLNMHTRVFLSYFCALWKNIRSKNCVLVVSEILRLFVNILTPDDKYSV